MTETPTGYERARLLAEPMPELPPPGADHDTILEAVRHHDAWFALRQPARTPCPPWCESPGKHEYDVWNDDLSVWSRFHEVSAGHGWCISREETVRDGVSMLGAVEISYHGDEICTDVAGAYDLIRNLHAAIEKAREIAAYGVSR